MHWGSGGGHAVWAHAFWWPLHLVFWFLILGLLVFALTRLFGPRGRWMAACFPGRQPGSKPDYGMPPVQPSALEILRQRYASGEIDAATFDMMRERLEGSGHPRE
jgi:uncharacterized membrane protein